MTTFWGATWIAWALAAVLLVVLAPLAYRSGQWAREKLWP